MPTFRISGSISLQVKDPSHELLTCYQNSDLITGVYEGGFKVWECALDLCTHLSGMSDEIENRRVLEIGCGCGVPGIVCLLCKAKLVAFQDFNSEVLEEFTKPTILANIAEKNAVFDRCQFFSGDWLNVENEIKALNQKFDLVISSETIYQPDSFPKLHNFLDTALTLDGTIILATKAHYFGIGGGTKAFEQYLQTEHVFTVSQKRCINPEAGLRREILILKRL